MKTEPLAEGAGPAVRSFNDFGVRLLATLAGDAPEKNVLLSPVSVALPFAMLLSGARGETEAALRKTLGLKGLELESLDRECNALLAALGDPDPRTALAVANGLWTQEGLDVAEAFARRLRDTYEAEIAHLDFGTSEAVEVINAWVADRTRGKIPQIVDDLNGAILVLVNALWFKGLWAKPFDPAETRDAEFTRADGKRVPCRSMVQKGSFEFAETRRVQALRLPYGDGRIAFYIFLPAPGLSCRETLGFLLPTWESRDLCFQYQRGKISLPRFRAEWGQELNDVLASLGMRAAFQGGADFSGIGAGPLMISQVVHKVLLEVDEAGSEAAAATLVAMLRGFSDSFEMIVDRPFACAIRDDQTGALLFAGWIADPSLAGSGT